ncbi:hypothetical protein RhiirC2_704768 [Rhizophagus irregularis]|uniref:Uncharacterized protein n=1 Tax=Rhizophagus irregularis TaxID=588596 RepID=A0A2N1P0V1_9GLOM|nr:hypothetical protein RhiirC2_704768 [Rhizophagus irregularis]
MEIIEILDEEIYDVNKDAQIIQNILQHLLMVLQQFLVYKDGKNHMDASNDTEINANQCSTIISKGSRTKNVNVHLLRLYVLVYISPPPLRKNFKDNLQVMIKEATEKDDVVTSQDFFGNRLALIVCMLEKQAQLLQRLEYFQIDLSF